ncbi:Reverse transcriptase domain - like 10 [Theobroma cacao]|nr:Reverse transcriptase domain - like 10 [Theobroma cacao]
MSTTRVSVLVNGNPTRQFGMKRRLRQDCPLSPFLFNITVEVLSNMIKRAKQMGICEEIRIGTQELKISHLQFVDDIVGKVPTTCLGLLLRVNHNSMAFWNSIIEKMEGKLVKWKFKMLSFNGRISMLKSMLVSFNLGLVVRNGENTTFGLTSGLKMALWLKSFRGFLRWPTTKIEELQIMEDMRRMCGDGIFLEKESFRLEVAQWDQLGNLLKDIQISKNLKDEMVWKSETNDLYSLKSFYKRLMACIEKRDNVWKNVWVGLAPHRIEAFVWQLLHEKIKVKDKLWIALSNVKSFFESRNDCHLGYANERTWRMAYFTILWTI